MTRRTLAAAPIAATRPSAVTIERKLKAAPPVKLRPNERVTISEFKRRPHLRRMARSIDIQSINSAFGSAAISSSQYDKIEDIADALQRIPRRDPGASVLIEGHTDAVGSFQSNQALSEQRAGSLKRTPVRESGVPGYALETSAMLRTFRSARRRTRTGRIAA